MERCGPGRVDEMEAIILTQYAIFDSSLGDMRDMVGG